MKPNRFLLYLKRFFLSLLVLSLVLYVMAWIFEDKLGKIALDLVQEEVTTKLELGEFDLSFIRAFPKISGTFEQVYLKDLHGDTLLYAQKMVLHLPWAILWSETREIYALEFHEGTVHLRQDKRGKPNYMVFKPSEDPDPSNPLSLNIRRCITRNMSISYQDDAGPLLLQAHLEDAGFKFNIEGDHLELDYDIAGSLQTLNFKDPALSNLEGMHLTGLLKIDLAKSSYTLEDAAIDFQGIEARLKGFWETTAKDTYIDLVLDANPVSLSELWPILQPHLPEIADIKSKGNANIQITAKGLMKGEKMPAVDASFTIEDAEIQLPIGGDIKQINTEVTWKQPLGKSINDSKLTIHHLDAMIDGEPLKAEGTISQFDNPLFDLKINGRLPVGLFANEKFVGKEGYIKMEDLVVKGKSKGYGLQVTGLLRPEGILMSYRNDPIQVQEGEINLSAQNWAIKDINLQIGDTKLQLEGTFEGLSGLLLGEPMYRSIRIKGDIRSENIDILAFTEQILRWQRDTTGQQTAEASAASTHFAGAVTLNVASFNYQDIKGKNFDGKLTLIQDSLLISGDTEAMDGTFNLEAIVSMKGPIKFHGNLTCEEVNVKKAFTECDNFGQGFITRDHLSGTLSTQVLFHSEWDSRGEFLPQKLKVQAAIQIDNGELIRFKMLESLSDFVHVKDLKHVKFSTLQNYLEVDRGKVYLPRMLIQCNAMALDVTGIHGFDQTIDYGLRVDAGQVLINKIARHDHSLAPKPNKRNGWFNLYYHIGGNVDDQEIKADRVRVKGDFVRSAQHRARIRQDLIEVFDQLLFTEESGEEEAFADNLNAGGNILPAIREGLGLKTINKSTIEERQEDSDPEYLDVEIEGGGAKKRKN
jgi:hypothetical protein